MFSESKGTPTSVTQRLRGESRRLAMKLVSLHPLIWSSLLVLWPSHSETEAYSPDVCQDSILGRHAESSGGYHVKNTSVLDNVRCLFHPVNTLNCSWSFLTLPYQSQLFVSISVCDDESQSLSYSSEERSGSWSSTLPEIRDPFVVLQLNITLNDTWILYSDAYDIEAIEILSPPKNISASVKDGSLLVTWDLPRGREKTNPSCFEYQLDLGDQEEPKHISNQLFHTEPNADPSCTYRVRIRAREDNSCQKNAQWSDWSHTVTVKQSSYKLNVLVIIAISLGVPMILLAVLLLMCHQRVSKVLFPPIPRPPPKYKFFLEKSDTFNLFYPPLKVEPEAEITEVEDTEQKPGKIS